MIIYVSDSINNKKNGGSSTSGFEFLQFLRIKYKDVVLITSDAISDEDLGNIFYDYNLNPVFSVEVIRRKVPVLDKSFRSLIRPLYYFIKDIGKRNRVDLRKYYTEKGDNILYINSWSAINTPNTLKNLGLFKKVGIVRGSPESFIYQSFELDKKLAVQNAADHLEQFDTLIYVSKNGLNDWSKILKKTIESYYLPNSINEYEINKANEISQEMAIEIVGFDKNSYNIVIVGSVQKRKAQDILLKVSKEFLDIKPNLKFHIVGVISKTWGGDKIFNEVQNSQYANNFVFHGHSEDVVFYIKAADICIFTSHAEAFPRTVAEYMALGKPILAADVSGVNEMIKHNENGYLYNSLEPNTLIDVFKKIESSNLEKNRLANNAYETYWNIFSKKIHILKAIDVFNKINNV